MVLVDTSVWINHFRRNDPVLSGLLETNSVLIHPFVIGELACGNLKGRSRVLGLLQRLPAATTAADEEVMHFIEERKLMGRGIGFIDAHLLASTVLSAPARLWTRDKALAAMAKDVAVLH